MGGIAFFRTAARDEVVEFYTERLGASVWLEQPGGCTILDHDGFRFGFCDAEEAETEGTLCFTYPHDAGVDAAYERLGDAAGDPPHENPEFDIYHAFGTDPEGRRVEVQSFR